MQMNRYYTVGIVEDEVIERQALRMIMEEKRPVLQVVFEAEDGNSALKMARQHQPDILIVDEILAVGDERFQRKSRARMLELMSGGATVLFVSHNLSQIRELCDRVIWLDHGRSARRATQSPCATHTKGRQPHE